MNRYSTRDEERIGSDLAGFNVADVDDPDIARAVFVCLAHFLMDERERRRVEPEIIFRSAIIGNVIINAAAAAALEFVGVRKLTHISVIVVRPHQCHVVRNF